VVVGTRSHGGFAGLGSVRQRLLHRSGAADDAEVDVDGGDVAGWAGDFGEEGGGVTAGPDFEDAASRPQPGGFRSCDFAATAPRSS
jgi:hypothetical protein